MRETTWRDAAGAAREACWPSESAAPSLAPSLVGDETTAAAALRLARSGRHLVYQGDFRNARQLLAAMGRRLQGRRPSPAGDLAARWRAVRAGRREDHEVLSRLAVPFDPERGLELRRAPDVRAALLHAFGDAGARPMLVPLREVLGAMGALEWRRKGVPVPALGGRVHPHHGVFAPVRGEHVELVAAELDASPAAGKLAFDLGTGTGVLAILLAQRGARVVATDLAPAAVASAREDVERFGLSARVEVVEADLFPPGRADLVVANPPWLPGEPETPLDRAVYDPGGDFLRRFLEDLADHLAPGGEGWLVISDLAEALGLRPPGFLEAAVAGAGLTVAGRRLARPAHPRSRDKADPLHEARARESVTLYRLRP